MMATKAKGSWQKVNHAMAMEALRRAKGDRKRAYSEYIRLTYQATGSFVPGCDNRDLQAFYDREGL